MTTTNKDKASWLAGLLSGWGIKESWAKIIAGAVIGALAAAGFLTGCTQAQVREVGHVAHAIYHADTGNPCIFNQVQEGK